MVEKLFWQNPYLTELETSVVTVNDEVITLKETIFFAFSGGQESDYGTINDCQVIEAKKEGTEIFYKLQTNHHIKPHDQVKVIINWERRYKLMRLHFAAELILELITRKLNIEKIGAHIAESKARIDFIYDKNISSVFAIILSEYNEIITSDKPIKTGFSDIEKQRRYWEIEGFSTVPCGGTHVKSSAEVGHITLKRVNIGSGKERIEIKLIDS